MAQEGCGDPLAEEIRRCDGGGCEEGQPHLGAYLLGSGLPLWSPRP